MRRHTARSSALIAITLLAGSPAGCVIVSTSRTVEGIDASTRDGGIGIDAPRVDIDAPGNDAAEGPVCERAEVRASIVRRVIMPTYTELEARAAELETAVVAYASSLSDPDRDAAREAWRRAIDACEEAEVMQVGPAGMTMSATGGGVAGGMDLRDQIYAWPLTNRCRIDQETVSGDFDDVDRFATETVNVRGLGALEYLLFYEPTTNGCASSSTINSSGAWAALGDAAVRERRARYARTLAVLVHREATRLRLEWEDEGSDFGGNVIRGDGVYADGQEALNAIFDALLIYADKRIKDAKVGGPAALDTMACMTASCPELLESRWASRSREHLLANLRAVRRVIVGGASAAEGAGFDDLLSCHDCAAAAIGMLAGIDTAIALLEALPTLDAASLPAQVEDLIALHAAIKSVTDLLKTDVATCLDLDLPDDVGSDND